MYNGNENFSNGKELMDNTIVDFWRWAYGDFLNNIQRSILAEYIVATAIESTFVPGENQRQLWRPYDLLSPEGWRIEVKCAAHVQEWKRNHPERVSYSIAPAKEPDETGNYREETPKKRNSDCYVFALYTATSSDENPLDLSRWDFYILKTEILDKERPNQKTISLSSLLKLNPRKCTYSELRSRLKEVMGNTI